MLADAPQFDIQAALNAWAVDPVKFVRDNFGVEPDLWQIDVLTNYIRRPRIAMKASKGVGKTAVEAWCIWHFLATRPFCKIACVAIDGNNLRDNLWSELALWRSRSEYLTKMFDQNSEQIRFRAAPQGTWFCSARTWQKNADANEQSNTLAGLHADHIMFVLDETGGMPSAIMASAENALSSAKEGHIIQAGNPTHLSGPLYDACTRQRRLWYVVTINGDPDSPTRSSRVSAEWARAQIELYGRDNPWVQVNVFGNFPPASINALIGVDEVEAAMKRMWRADELRADPRILGVDVARFGDDASVICRRQGLQVWPFTKYRNIDGVQGAGVVARIWRDWQADACFLDGTGGWATSWEDQLRRMRYSPVSIPFSAQAHDPGKFINKRAEMYWDAVEFIKRGGALPNDPALLAELTQTTYSFRGDKIILEDKEMIKVKLGYSPDEADALCFVAGTRIATPEGDVPIEHVEPGNTVLTPTGRAIVVKRWETKTPRLTEVVMSCGERLKGRPEHKVFVYGHGLVRLDALSLTMALSPLSERVKWVSASESFTAIRSIGFKAAVATFPRAFRFSASASCIAVYGLSIMAQFRKVMRSTIRMTTGVAAKSTISNSSPKPSTTLCTQFPEVNLQKGRSENAGIWHKAEIWLGLGTPRQKDWSGTASMGKRHGRGGSLQIAHARAAAAHSNHSSPPEQSSALARASSLYRFGAISRIAGRALGAAMSLWLTAIARRHVVPVSVQTENVEPTTVYNLTLDRDNAYYANGVLVFNCLTFAEPVSRAQAPLSSVSQMNNRNHKAYNPFRESDGDGYGGTHYD